MKLLNGLKAVLAIVVLMSCSGCATSLTKEITKLGFTPVQPPRDSLRPGTLIVLRNLSGGNLGLQAVCWPAQAFPGLGQPVTNVAASTVVKTHLEKSFTIDPNYLEQIKGKIDISQIKSIELSLTNVLVLEYSDADLLGVITNRQAACSNAVDQEGKLERNVLTVLQVLQADVVYHVISSNRLGANVTIPETVLDGLRLSLGGQLVNTNNSTITGAKLVWGLYPDHIGVSKVPGGFETVMVPDSVLTPQQRKALTRQIVTDVK